MKLAAMFGSSSGAIGAVAIGAVVVVAGAVGFTILSDDADIVPTAPLASIDVEAVVTPEVVPEGTVVTAEVVPEDTLDVAAPRLDLVRVDPQGSTVIAGHTSPGTAVAILLDGTEVFLTQADRAGDFVALITLAPSDSPRILGVEARPEDGSVLAGVETIIVAPFGAASEPEPQVAQAPDLQVAPDTPGTPDMADTPGTPAPDSPAIEEIAALSETSEGPEVGAVPAPLASTILTQTPQTPQSVENPVTPDTPLMTGEVATPEAPDTPLATGEGAAPEAPDTPLATDVPETPAPETPAPETPGETTSPGVSPTAPGALAAAPATLNAPDLSTSAPPPVQSNDTRPAITAPARALAPAVVIAGPDGLRITQGPGAEPAVQTVIRLDVISYDAQGAVTLAGRGPAAADIQVYINNQPIQLGEIGPNGAWSLQLPDVDPGTYTLSVAELAADGSTASVVETPFLREDPVRVAETPARSTSGIEVITVQPGFTLWGMAHDSFGDGILYVQIFEENRDQIRDPDWIFPGQIFRIPDLERVTDGN